MPGYNLLLAPCALSLLAGVLGLAASALCVSSDDKDYLNAGRVGFVASAVLLALGGLLLLTTFARVPPSDRRRLWRALFGWTIVAAIMVIPTALLFGPTGGFHYHIGFGPIPFFYMVWNGEDPAPGSFQIVEGYEVWFSPILCGVLVGVWLLVFAIVIAVAGPIPRGVGISQSRVSLLLTLAFTLTAWGCFDLSASCPLPVRGRGFTQSATPHRPLP